MRFGDITTIAAPITTAAAPNTTTAAAPPTKAVAMTFNDGHADHQGFACINERQREASLERSAIPSSTSLAATERK